MCAMRRRYRTSFTLEIPPQKKTTHTLFLPVSTITYGEYVNKINRSKRKNKKKVCVFVRSSRESSLLMHPSYDMERKLLGAYYMLGELRNRLGYFRYKEWTGHTKKQKWNHWLMLDYIAMGFRWIVAVFRRKIKEISSSQTCAIVAHIRVGPITLEYTIQTVHSPVSAFVIIKLTRILSSTNEKWYQRYVSLITNSTR